MRRLTAFYIFFSFISVSRWTQVTSLEEEDEEEEIGAQNPDLSCLLFGDIGCHISCRVKGNLYRSQINGYCTPSAHCVPTLIRSVSSSSEQLTRREYENLPFDALWFRKFEPSTSATTVQKKLSQNPRLKERVRQLLRNTRNTGQDIKHQLMATFPRWSATLRDLTPKRQGMVNDFVTNSYELDSEALSEIVKARVAELSEQFTISLNAQITRHLNRLNADNVKHLMRGVASLDEPNLYAQLRDYLRRRGHRIADEEFVSSAVPQHAITKEDMDGILTVAVVKALVNRKKEENDRGTLTLPGVANSVSSIDGAKVQARESRDYDDDYAQSNFQEGNMFEDPGNDYYYYHHPERGRPYLSDKARLLYPESIRYNDDFSKDSNRRNINYMRDTADIPNTSNETPLSDDYWKTNYYGGRDINSNEYANLLHSNDMYQHLFDVEHSNSEYCSCEEGQSVPSSSRQKEEIHWEGAYRRNLARRSVDYSISSYESSSSEDTSGYYAGTRDIESLNSYSTSASDYDADESKYEVERHRKKKKHKRKKHKRKKRKKKIHHHIDHSDDSSVSDDDCPYHGGGMGSNCW